MDEITNTIVDAFLKSVGTAVAAGAATGIGKVFGLFRDRLMGHLTTSEGDDAEAVLDEAEADPEAGGERLKKVVARSGATADPELLDLSRQLLAARPRTSKRVVTINKFQNRGTNGAVSFGNGSKAISRQVVRRSRKAANKPDGEG